MMRRLPGEDRPFCRWLDRGPSLRSEFEGADPFPLVVLDDFLGEDLARALYDSFRNRRDAAFA